MEDEPKLSHSGKKRRPKDRSEIHPDKNLVNMARRRNRIGGRMLK